MRHDVADFAVLAFADRNTSQTFGALVALQRRIDRAVFDTVDLDALFQFIELRLRDLAVGADAIAPQPAVSGSSSARASPPSLVSSRRPSVLKSSRPIEISRGNPSGRLSNTVGRPQGRHAWSSGRAACET